MWGCGLLGLDGGAEVCFGKEKRPYSRTCPQYYRRLPWVQQVLMDLEDYRRGSMGDVMRLEAPHLQLLRAADVEQSRWQSEQERQIAAQR